MVRCPLRRLLLRWIGWFFCINTGISVLIQMTYLRFLTDLHVIPGSSVGNRVLSWAFLIASYIAHTTLLNFGVALIPILICLILPKKRVIFPTAFVLAAVLIICQLVDRIAFSIFHTHALGEVWVIFKTNSLSQVLPLSNLEISLLVLIVLLVVLAEAGIGYLTLQAVRKHPGRFSGYGLGAFLSAMVAFSYGLMASVVTVPAEYRLNAAKSRLILRMARLVPYYRDLYNLLLPNDHHYKLKIQTADGSVPVQLIAPAKAVVYPRHALVSEPKKPLPNIVFIVIDTWRYDTMSASVTPHMARLARKSLQFKNNWSGGNCTKTGIFSLFYSLPANYWNPFLAQSTGPVFIKTLKKYDYQMEVLGSATLRFPQFEKTVFVDLNTLPGTKGTTTMSRDREITADFESFLKNRDRKRPFFSFIFYDSVHNYCEGSGRTHQKPFQPAVQDCARYALTQHTDPTPYLNRYRNAAHFVDREVHLVVHDLKDHGLFKNTIIVVTADHGEEFNDEKLGYWSHGTAYTPYQLQVPLFVYWPGMKPKVIQYKTTHFDIVPTLLKNVFGVTNPMADYSMGRSLFEAGDRPFIIAGSYDDYAVVGKNQITRIYPGGDYIINHINGWHIPNAQLDARTMSEAYEQLNRFYAEPDRL